MADFEYPAGAKAAGSPDISRSLTPYEAREMILSAIPFGVAEATDLLNEITWETATILWPSIGRIGISGLGPDGTKIDAIDVSIIHTGNN